jgi:hypothetical protein
MGKHNIYLKVNLISLFITDGAHLIRTGQGTRSRAGDSPIYSQIYVSATELYHTLTNNYSEMLVKICFRFFKSVTKFSVTIL